MAMRATTAVASASSKASSPPSSSTSGQHVTSLAISSDIAPAAAAAIDARQSSEILELLQVMAAKLTGLQKQNDTMRADHKAEIEAVNARLGAVEGCLGVVAASNGLVAHMRLYKAAVQAVELLYFCCVSQSDASTATAMAATKLQRPTRRAYRQLDAFLKVSEELAGRLRAQGLREWVEVKQAERPVIDASTINVVPQSSPSRAQGLAPTSRGRKGQAKLLAGTWVVRPSALLRHLVRARNATAHIVLSKPETVAPDKALPKVAKGFCRLADSLHEIVSSIKEAEPETIDAGTIFPGGPAATSGPPGSPAAPASAASAYGSKTSSASGSELHRLAGVAGVARDYEWLKGIQMMVREINTVLEEHVRTPAPTKGGRGAGSKPSAGRTMPPRKAGQRTSSRAQHE